MSHQTALKYLICKEYFALEETTKIKHEFFQGEIFAMSGGTFNHAAIGSNTVTALKIRLRGNSNKKPPFEMAIK